MMFNERKIKNVVKAAIPVYLCLLMFLTGSCSTAPASNPNAALSSNNNNSNAGKAEQRVSLFDNRVSFALPAGFKHLPAAEIKRELPDNAARDNIYSNADQTAYISSNLDRDMPFETAQLSEMKGFVERLHKNYSGWKTSEIIELNGRQWFHFEYEKPVASELGKLVAPVETDEPDPNSNVNAVKEKKKPEVKNDKPIYFRSYTTSLSGQMFTITFEADADKYPQVKEAFNETIKTIRLKD